MTVGHRIRRTAGAALTGAAASAVAWRGLRARPPGGESTWARTNAAGATVTLLEGPAYAVGAAAAVLLTPGVAGRARAAGLLAVGGAAAFGSYDDLAGSGAARGLRGHLGALARGEVTTGAVKVVGIGVTGLLSGALVRRQPVDALLAGAVVAGTANMANLLDLRPGRALKAGLAAGVPLVLSGDVARDRNVLAAAALGPALVLLPPDLAARSMLGDAGANALGALIGLASVTGASRSALATRLGVLVALTLASERVSFTRVIEATPGLRELDRLGRPPARA